MEHFGTYLVAAAVFCYVVTFTSAAAVSTIDCSVGTECDSIPNSACDITPDPDVCKCNTGYKDGTGADDGACVVKDVGDYTCSVNTDCTGGTTNIANSACVSGNCACTSAFKAVSGACVAKDVGDYTCSVNTDCTGGTTNIANSACVSGNCACTSAFKAVSGACVAKGLTDACSANSDCSDVAGASCSTTCVCAGLYEDDSGNAGQCAKKACTGDCNTVSNAECTTSQCTCKQYYIEAFGQCPAPGLGDACGVEGDCSAVSNSECVGTPTKMCTCKTSYTESNGQCNAAAGLKTLSSAPIALLLSFLTVVVTKLH